LSDQKAVYSCHRLEAEQTILEAFRQGIDEVQSVFTSFEKLLNEDKKKRLEALLVDTLTP
jgi:hypothetical protein